jgi:hypothetical protein
MRAAPGGKRVVQLAGCHCRGRSGRDSAADRSRVEAFRDAHDGDAGFAVARHDGAVDGGGAAPARQQRGVEIKGAVRRGLEDGARQNQPIGHDHGSIGTKRREALLLLGALEPRGGEHGQTRLLGNFMHRRLAQRHAPPGGARRLGVDRSHAVASFEDAVKRRYGEVGRAMKMMRRSPLCHRRG